MDVRASCVEFISSVHGQQRRRERDVSKRDLQAAVKYGVKEKALPHPRTKEPRWKYTFADVVYITDPSSTVEVTSWALQLPLEEAPVEASMLQQFAVQKKRLRSGHTPITSHTVMVVDQSTSMNQSDVHGHRSRSRGAYYAIANEMIAQPLLGGHVSFTDVVTIIEMRDEAAINPEIYMDPVTWELHNKVVQLAKEPLRAKGNGNYKPALQLACNTLLQSSTNDCALLLLFLSDGRPSDKITKQGHT